jgi:hypothetical protein
MPDSLKKPRHSAQTEQKRSLTWYYNYSEFYPVTSRVLCRMHQTVYVSPSYPLDATRYRKGVVAMVNFPYNPAFLKH